MGTNALLEEKGAKTGLLVTQGFRGIYEVMEHTRGYGPATYDLFFEKPRLLAPPYLTEEIPERIDFRGNVLKPILYCEIFVSHFSQNYATFILNSNYAHQKFSS